MCYAHSSKKTWRGGTNYARRQYRKKKGKYWCDTDRGETWACVLLVNWTNARKKARVLWNKDVVTLQYCCYCCCYKGERQGKMKDFLLFLSPIFFCSLTVCQKKLVKKRVLLPVSYLMLPLKNEKVKKENDIINTLLYM